MFVILSTTECIVLSDKGALADHLGLSRHTVVHWFRDANFKQYANISIWKVNKVIKSKRGGVYGSINR